MCEGSHVNVLLVNAEETLAAGERLGRLLQPGDAVAIEGLLGAGKTTLVQGICRGLEVTGEVASPTFALMNVYHGCLPVYHLDVYRLQDERRLALLGYEPELAASGVTLVEWADKVWPFWTSDVLRVRLAFDADASGGQGRRLQAEALGPRSAQRLAFWERTF